MRMIMSMDPSMLEPCNRGLSNMKCYTRVFAAISSLLYAQSFVLHPVADPKSDGYWVRQNVDVGQPVFQAPMLSLFIVMTLG